MTQGWAVCKTLPDIDQASTRQAKVETKSA